MALRMVKPDQKGRITLGHLADGVNRFSVVEDKEHGKIILTPYVEILASEAWLFRNKEALKKVKQGLADAASGKVRKKGSGEITIIAIIAHP